MEILRCLMPQLIRRGELQESPAGFGLAHHTRNAHMVRPTAVPFLPGEPGWEAANGGHVKIPMLDL